MAQRVRWTSKYEKGLVDLLMEYNLSQYHGQNGWYSEGWNWIVEEENALFPDARLTKAQIQDKEAGISWNPTSCMINTTPEKWDEIIEEDSKLRKYEGKSFPLFEALDLLYEGNIAQGKLCFTTSQPPNNSSSRKHQRDESYSTRNLPPRVDRMTSQRWESSIIEDEIQNSRYDVDKRDGDEMPRDHFDEEVAEDGDEVQEIQRSGDHANSRSGISGVQSTKGKKQKGNSSFLRIEQTMSEYVNFKKEQVIMKEQASKQGQQYSIPRCLEVLNAMDSVSDDIKVLASDVFKDAANRELFLCYDSKLRGLWLKKEVDSIAETSQV
ncbi:hypothetical protein BRADI_3g11101v3 [Brachypodium distachyon]|uniref:Myb/SANT-like domain-containing protein n=1 Tax=Brachypodium distachyon TaxID=15368 RepID=A0A2K2CWJ6_BRADI|nr:hypothetical protein BRADI_3g11101v3 [Brachypodium distachyon]